MFSILGSFLWGVSNFTYSYLTAQDFAVTCLSFSGFFFASFAYKIIELNMKADKITGKVVFDSFFGEFRKLENAIHLILRSVNFFVMIFLTIISAEYASKAGINFGIITSLSTTATIFTAISFYLMFREVLNKKTLAGIVIVIAGIAMITMSNTGKSDISSNYSE